MEAAANSGNDIIIAETFVTSSQSSVGILHGAKTREEGVCERPRRQDKLVQSRPMALLIDIKSIEKSSFFFFFIKLLLSPLK